MKLLMDTNIVSYWHSGNEKFRAPLTAYMRKIRRNNKQISLFISVITVQELACWSKPTGGWEAIHQFLRSKFAPPLPFCELCALQAATMQANAGPQGKIAEAEKAEWHHDVAIVGTAAHHGLDVVLTSDRALSRRYAPFFEEIVCITEAGG